MCVGLWVQAAAAAGPSSAASAAAAAAASELESGESVRMSSIADGGGAESTMNTAPTKANDKASTPPLVFESRFETGNLQRAVRVYDREYDLHLGTAFCFRLSWTHLERSPLSSSAGEAAERCMGASFCFHAAPDLTDPESRCQWFYFSVRGAVPGLAYKFNVVNLVRTSTSLQPLHKQLSLLASSILLPVSHPPLPPLPETN